MSLRPDAITGGWAGGRAGFVAFAIRVTRGHRGWDLAPKTEGNAR